MDDVVTKRRVLIRDERELIALLGEASGICRALKLNPPLESQAMIRSWKRRGRIARQYRARVKALAEQKGFSVPADFLNR